MENTDPDRMTRQILANSRIDIDYPDFSRLLLHKIEARHNRKLMLGKALVLFFMVIAAEVLALILIRYSHTDASTFVLISQRFGIGIILKMLEIKSFIVGNSYLVLPFIVMILFKKMMESRLRYS